MNMNELEQVAITSVKKYARRLEVDDREIHVRVCKPDDTPDMEHMYNAVAGCAQSNMTSDVVIIFNEDVMKMISESSDPDYIQSAYIDAVAGHEVAHIIPFKDPIQRTMVMKAGGIDDGTDVHAMRMKKAGCVEADDIISPQLQGKLGVYRMMRGLESHGFGQFGRSCSC